MQWNQICTGTWRLHQTWHALSVYRDSFDWLFSHVHHVSGWDLAPSSMHQWERQVSMSSVFLSDTKMSHFPHVKTIDIACLSLISAGFPWFLHPKWFCMTSTAQRALYKVPDRQGGLCLETVHWHSVPSRRCKKRKTDHWCEDSRNGMVYWVYRAKEIVEHKSEGLEISDPHIKDLNLLDFRIPAHIQLLTRVRQICHLKPLDHLIVLS